MLILVENTGKLEGFNMLSVLLSGCSLLGRLVLDVDGGLDSVLDGFNGGRSHGCCCCCCCCCVLGKRVEMRWVLMYRREVAVG